MRQFPIVSGSSDRLEGVFKYGYCPHSTLSKKQQPSTMLARTLRLAGPARLPLLVPSARYVHQSKPTPPNERPSLATDPYPLPLTQPLADDPSAAPQRSGQTSLDTLDEELSLPQPLDRTGEDVDTLRARLVYQTRKRGTLETDLILSTFAKEHLPTMSEEEMKQFDKASWRKRRTRSVLSADDLRLAA